MHLSSRLDCDLVAVESADELMLLVELTAPTPAVAAPRLPATLQVVLDRSGSMGGARLEGAQTALLGLVDRLDPADNFGVVAFDDTVGVVVPCAPLADKPAARAAISSVYPGGATDLSGGYLRALQEVKRVAAPGGSTVLLVSDGHANRGTRDPQVLSGVAAEAAGARITTSTLGFGLGYDETLLSALAQGGRGNEHFAEEADAAGALIAGEVDGLLAQVAQAATLRVRLRPGATGVALLNAVPHSPTDDGVLVELGSFYAGEARRLVLRLQVPSLPDLGLAEVAVLELVSVSLPDLVEHTSTVPVAVNVVPGDQTAGRLRDPEVRSEALFQQSQRAKKESSRLLSQGDVGAAQALLHSAVDELTAGAAPLPPAAARELREEARLMSSLADEAGFDASRAAKAGSSDSARKSRSRGRRVSGSGLLLRAADGAARLPLEDWQVHGLRRQLPPELADALVSGGSAVTAAQIAAVLEPGSPERAFFDAASVSGFTVERA